MHLTDRQKIIDLYCKVHNPAHFGHLMNRKRITVNCIIIKYATTGQVEAF